MPPTSNNTLKELFISLNLDGVKEGVRGMNRLEKATEEADVAGERLNDTTEEQARNITFLRRQVDRLSRSFVFLNRQWARFGRGLSAVRGGLERITGFIQRLISSLGRIPIVGGLVAAVGGAIGAGFGLSGVQGARADQDAERLLQIALRARGREGQFGAITQRAGRIQDRFFIGADEIIKGAAGLANVQAINIQDIPALATIAAQLKEVRPEQDIQAIFKSIQELIATGEVTDAIKLVAPELTRLRIEQRTGNQGIAKLQQTLERLTAGQPIDTLSQAIRRFGQVFDTFLKTAGAPIARNLNKILNAFTRFFTGATIGRLGNLLARTAGSIADIIFGFFGVEDPERDIPTGVRELFDPSRSGFFRFLFQTFDLFRFIFGDEEARRRSAVATLVPSGEPLTVFNLFRSVIRILLTNVLESFKNSLIAGFLAAFGPLLTQLIQAIPLSNFQPDPLLRGLETLPFEERQDLIRRRLEGTSRDRPATPVERSGAVNFNNDIRIVTNQPASAIAAQLNTELALLGNIGQLS